MHDRIDSRNLFTIYRFTSLFTIYFRSEFIDIQPEHGAAISVGINRALLRSPAGKEERAKESTNGQDSPPALNPKS